MIKRKHYRDIGFFVAGTFLGGWVLGLFSGLLSGVKRKV